MLNGNSSAYGFRIRSPYPVRFLRAGGGEDQLDVAPALERPPAPSGPSLCEWTYRAAGEAVEPSRVGEAADRQIGERHGAHGLRAHGGREREDGATS